MITDDANSVKYKIFIVLIERGSIYMKQKILAQVDNP